MRKSLLIPFSPYALGSDPLSLRERVGVREATPGNGVWKRPLPLGGIGVKFRESRDRADLLEFLLPCGGGYRWGEATEGKEQHTLS